ncbi:tetratricopeptide repeat protein [Candidatus Sumerlaeota bacterium]|nr:tetratricopeptide repeat protein [Candidatus Sumerlaeota bacterium]
MGSPEDTRAATLSITRGQARLAFLAIAALALTLRLINIGGPSFHYDEMTTVGVAYEAESIGHLFELMPGRTGHPPIQHLLLYFLPHTSNPEVTLRLAMVLISLIPLWLLYLIARTTLTRGASLFTSLLWAISPMSVEYSVEVRMYLLWLLFSLLSLLLFMKAHWQSKRRLWALFPLAGTAAVLSHFMAVFFLWILGLWATLDTAVRLWRWRGSRREALLSWALFAAAGLATGALSAVWLPRLILVRQQGTLPIYPPVPHSVLGESFTSVLQFPSHVHIPYLFLGLPSFYLVSSLTALGVIALMAQRRMRFLGMTAFLIVAGSIGTVFFCNWLQQYFSTRYNLLYSALWCLWGGAGLGWVTDRLPRRAPVRAVAASALAAALLFAVWGSLERFWSRQVDDCKGAVAVIAEHLDERPVVLLAQQRYLRILGGYLLIHRIDVPTAYVRDIGTLRDVLSESDRTVFLAGELPGAHQGEEVIQLEGIDLIRLPGHEGRTFEDVLGVVNAALGQTGGSAYQRYWQAIGRGDMLLSVGDAEGALAAFEEAERSGFRDVRVHERLGDALMRLGRHEEALEQRLQTVEFNPVNAWYRLQVALAHRAMGDLEQARHWLDTALEIDPQEPTAHLESGMIEVEAGNWEAATEHLQHIGEIETPNFWYYVRPAGALLRAGQIDLVQSLIDRGLEEYPGNPEIMCVQGRLAERRGQWQEALEAYTLASEPQSTNVEPELRIASILLVHLGDAERARAVCEQALLQNPDHPWAHYYLAQAAARMGDSGLAWEHAARAVELGINHPGTTELALNLAMTVGECERGIEIGLMALERRPDDPVARLNVAQCLLALGRLSEAHEIYDPARGAPELERHAEAVRALETALGQE